MPIAEAGFFAPDGTVIPSALLNLGPTVQVLVSGVPANIPPQAGGVAAGVPAAQVVNGLVDTGAAQSCIDSDLAARLNLPVIDRVTLSGSNGAHQHDVFAAQVSVPVLGIIQTGRFAGVHLAGGQQPHHVLLGRTFLQNVVMVYDGRRSQVMLASATALFGGFGGFPLPIIPAGPEPLQMDEAQGGAQAPELPAQ